MLNRTLALCDEMYQSDPPNRDRTRKLHYQLLAMLAFLDDKTALAELDDARQGNMRDIAILGRHAWYLAQWWKNVEDEKKSAALLDELEKLATANPLDDDLAALLIQLQQEGTADDAQLHRLETIITAHLRGPLALKFTAEIKLAEKRRSLLGKPLLISAPTLKGQPFTSKSLLGHLVLVHFGISSLGPWEQEHNLLLQQYAKLQDQDIQVITILCDEKQEDVDQYVQRHRAIPWPVLRDPTRPANLAALYGIEQFPQALLLAPDGTVKQVDVNLHDPQALANLLTSLATTRPTTRP